jgi:hypothetical protein
MRLFFILWFLFMLPLATIQAQKKINIGLSISTGIPVQRIKNYQEFSIDQIYPDINYRIYPSLRGGIYFEKNGIKRIQPGISIEYSSITESSKQANGIKNKFIGSYIGISPYLNYKINEKFNISAGIELQYLMSTRLKTKTTTFLYQNFKFKNNIYSFNSRLNYSLNPKITLNLDLSFPLNYFAKISHPTDPKFNFNFQNLSPMVGAYFLINKNKVSKFNNNGYTEYDEIYPNYISSLNLGLFYNYNFPAINLNLSYDRIIFRSLRHLTLGVVYNYAFMDTKENFGISFGGRGLYHFYIKRKIDTYGGIGGSYGNFKYPPFFIKSFRFTYYLGVKYDFSKRFGGFIELSNFRISKETLPIFGLSYRLN